MSQALKERYKFVPYAALFRAWRVAEVYPWGLAPGLIMRAFQASRCSRLSQCSTRLYQLPGTILQSSLGTLLEQIPRFSRPVGVDREKGQGV
jgi:hypothetical protein